MKRLSPELLSELEIDKMSLPCVGQDGLPWPQTFDANAWAIEFCKRFGTESIDEALMIGWFSNAIMRGFDHQSPEIQRLQAENESLWALAKFGRFCVEAINKYSGPTDNFSIKCFVEACESGLIKMAETGSSSVITETPLAQLPEKRE